jgi:hypothetical protein
MNKTYFWSIIIFFKILWVRGSTSDIWNFIDPDPISNAALLTKFLILLIFYYLNTKSLNLTYKKQNQDKDKQYNPPPF